MKAKLCSHFRFTIQVEVKVTSKEDLAALELSDSRIVLLYSTRQEGSDIMKWAAEAGLTGDSFVWVATQSVIGEVKEALPELPAGMLGKSIVAWKSANEVRILAESSLLMFEISFVSCPYPLWP